MVILRIDFIIHMPYLHFDTQFHYTLGIFVYFVNSLANSAITDFSFSLFLCFIYLLVGWDV